MITVLMQNLEENNMHPTAERIYTAILNLATDDPFCDLDEFCEAYEIEKRDFLEFLTIGGQAYSDFLNQMEKCEPK